MQSLELVKSSELIMVFRISKIHTNADFTFSNNNFLNINSITIDKNYIFGIIRVIKKERRSTGGKMIIK